MEPSLDIDQLRQDPRAQALSSARTTQSILPHTLTEIIDGTFEPFTEFGPWLPGQFLTELARINHAPYLFAAFGWPMNFLACRICVRDQNPEQIVD